jgi:hypothetical protein
VREKLEEEGVDYVITKITDHRYNPRTAELEYRAEMPHWDDGYWFKASRLSAKKALEEYKEAHPHKDYLAPEE